MPAHQSDLLLRMGHLTSIFSLRTVCRMASVPSTSLIAPGGLLRFSIDRGGTFTDVVAEFPTHPDLVAEKGTLLALPSDAPLHP